MTEPEGASSDAANSRGEIRREGSGSGHACVIDGRKGFTSGTLNENVRVPVANLLSCAQPARGPKRARLRRRTAAASASRVRGGACVTSAAISVRADAATSSTARSKASRLACDGTLKPLSLRTNCSEASRISNSVAGGSKLNSVLMLRHMAWLPAPVAAQADCPEREMHTLAAPSYRSAAHGMAASVLPRQPRQPLTSLSPPMSVANKSFRHAMACACAAALLLGGCASSSYNPNPTRDTAVGAAAGAAVGAAVHGSNRTHGALAGAAVGALGSAISSSQMAKQKQQMEAATRGSGVQVTQTADNQLKLEVPSDISFATGSARITPALEPILDRFAQTLAENPKTTVRIVGHTDSTGSDAINDPLSVNRASSVRNYLSARGVAADRIAIDGRGAREPIADNASDAGRARNRRVDIFVGESAA